MRVEYREEPCRSALNRVRRDAVRVVAQPVHGLRPPLHVLLRPGVRGPRRPARRRPLRAEHPREDERGRGAAARARAALLERRRRSRSARRPTRTSPPRAATGSRGRASRCSARRRRPFSIITRGPLIVRDVDVLAAAARRADVSVTFSVPTLDREIWRRTEPGTAPPRQRLRALAGRSSRRGSASASGWRRSCPGSPTVPTCSPLSSARRARRARPGSGRTCSTSSRARGSTSSPALERDWPELLPDYERLYARRAYLPAAEAAPVRAQVRDLARAARRPRPPPPPARPGPARGAADALDLTPRMTSDPAAYNPGTRWPPPRSPV